MKQNDTVDFLISSINVQVSLFIYLHYRFDGEQDASEGRVSKTPLLTHFFCLFRDRSKAVSALLHASFSDTSYALFCQSVALLFS